MIQHPAKAITNVSIITIVYLLAVFHTGNRMFSPITDSDASHCLSYRLRRRMASLIK